MGSCSLSPLFPRRKRIMRWIVRSSCALAAAALGAGVVTGTIDAQGVTTAAITGTVTDSAGARLDGARVVATHGPSGTTYTGVTRADGRFPIPGMRVGGPYRVSASLVGYRQEVQDGINLTLGVTADVRFQLRQVSVQLEAITVTTTASSVFSSERTGAATTVASGQIAAAPVRSGLNTQLAGEIGRA